MGFGNLQTADGLRSLNTFLLDKSYIGGYRPTQGDVAVFEAVKSAPAAEFVNALRWFNHIASFNNEEKAKFQGERKAADAYGPQSCPAAAAAPAKADDDDDVDLFGDDNEEESEQTKQRLAAYAEKKAKKPAVVAKSNIVLDVKPWDDETNMQELEEKVRSIQMDGLLWGASRLVPLAFTIKKLQITCVVEDDKVGTDILEESIMEFSDHVQSVDIASFQKI